jgi:hypothetical protein
MSALMLTNTVRDDTGLPYNEGMRKRTGLLLLAVVVIGVVAVVAISTRPTAPFAFIERREWQSAKSGILRLEPDQRGYTFVGYWPKVLAEADKEFRSLGYQDVALHVNDLAPAYSLGSWCDPDVEIKPSNLNFTFMTGEKPMSITVVVNRRIPNRSVWSSIFAVFSRG